MNLQFIFFFGFALDRPVTLYDYFAIIKGTFNFPDKDNVIRGVPVKGHGILTIAAAFRNGDFLFGIIFIDIHQLDFFVYMAAVTGYR